MANSLVYTSGLYINNIQLPKELKFYPTWFEGGDFISQTELVISSSKTGCFGFRRNMIHSFEISGEFDERSLIRIIEYIKKNLKYDISMEAIVENLKKVS